MSGSLLSTAWLVHSLYSHSPSLTPHPHPGPAQVWVVGKSLLLGDEWGGTSGHNRTLVTQIVLVIELLPPLGGC